MSIIKIVKKTVGYNVTDHPDVPFGEEYTEKAFYFLGIKLYSCSKRVNALQDTEKEIQRELKT